jgi:hypothetical protein
MNKEKNGFEALASFNGNGDGVIDVSDAIFEKLKAWVGTNSNGISTNKEPMSTR